MGAYPVINDSLATTIDNEAEKEQTAVGLGVVADHLCYVKRR